MYLLLISNVDLSYACWPFVSFLWHSFFPLSFLNLILPILKVIYVWCKTTRPTIKLKQDYSLSLPLTAKLMQVTKLLAIASSGAVSTSTPLHCDP